MVFCLCLLVCIVEHVTLLQMKQRLNFFAEEVFQLTAWVVFAGMTIMTSCLKNLLVLDLEM